MQTITFNRADNWTKQKDIAIYAISKLSTNAQYEVVCHDYASALSLARLVQRFDPQQSVSEIHVFSYFVRLIRHKSGSFRFSAQVIDHHGAKFFNQWER